MKNNRICHLTSVHRWFDERIFQKEAKSLARAGYNVSIIVQSGSCSDVDGIHIVSLSPGSNRIRRVATTAWLSLKQIQNHDMHVFHFHDPELIPVGILLKLLGKKVIYDVHEDYERDLMARNWLGPRMSRRLASFWWMFERAASHFFDYIITVAENIKIKFPEHKTEVVTNAPPLSFLAEEKQMQASGPFKIMYVGLIAAERGIFKVVEALDYLKEMDVELHIFGSVADEKTSAEFDAHPRIVFHGRVPWNLLRSQLQDGDLGLLLFQPNLALTHVSGEGNTKLFEYMSLGMPVLISDFPNLKQFVYSLGAGYAVDPTDPKAIADAIDFLYEHPELRKKMGMKGREAVRTKYNWEYQEKKLLRVYEKVLSTN
jgi:glycosyltransferase involved in cell wall biosynthesis